MDLKKFRLTTIIVIVAFLIIALYALTEVNYYSYKNAAEPVEYNASVVSIPSIGVFERINNVSISQGVYIDENSSLPTEGDVVLFGHRTLQGSVFLRLNELKPGDIITLQWPGIGEVNYTLNTTKIVPASYVIELNESHKEGSIENQDLYLVTCNPIGSTSERLICIADLNSNGTVNETALKENPQAYYAWYIILAFFIFGLAISYFNKGTDRKIILIVIIILTIVLVYFAIFPVSSQIWADKLGVLNSWMGVA